jgi:hypothetical protein
MNQFLDDVKSHLIDVKLDQWVYRHMVFSRPDTNCMHFSLTTTPGRLTFAGDMGCYVFERCVDMFSFFRGEREPNYGYWHEKLVAVDRCSGSEEWSSKRFRENLEQYITGDLSGAEMGRVREFIDHAVSVFEDDGPEIAFREVNDFSLDDSLKNRHQFFTDFWEFSHKEYTTRYIWACHAIQWGIAQYDKFKGEKQ